MDTTITTESQCYCYGQLLANEIRRTVADISNAADFERFVLDRGWQYKTVDTLRTAYGIRCKALNGILISADDFKFEAGKHYDADVLEKVYQALFSLVKSKKLKCSDVYSYAHYGWCLRNPNAIIAYQEEHGKWIVNNCSTETTEERAIVEVNREWGFEASRIEVVGTPYYDATDYQFVRFDCAHMMWLWQNSTLYQVYT